VTTDDLEERLAGTLLGTALGDALGLPAERLSAAAITRRWGRVERFHMWGQTGFVSDDTEQAALLAQSLARHPADLTRCAHDFRRALLGWFLRLPWGIGRATVRSCVRIALGLEPSGVHSAGNGAAMRAAVVGVFFWDWPLERGRWSRALAETTHLDERAVEGALFVAELAAACASQPPETTRAALFDTALASVGEPVLRAALLQARELATQGAETAESAASLQTTGYVVHSVSFAAYCFLRHGDAPLPALTEAISAGGDTDSIAAILGGWLGARYGAAGLAAELLNRLHDGPFGPTHLRKLAHALADRRGGGSAPVPSYSVLVALLRNVALFFVVLAHAVRRLLR